MLCCKADSIDRMREFKERERERGEGSKGKQAIALLNGSDYGYHSQCGSGVRSQSRFKTNNCRYNHHHLSIDNLII
jgi:hypothetical protein